MRIRVVGGPVTGNVTFDVKSGETFANIFRIIEKAVDEPTLWQRFQLHPAILITEDGARRVRPLPHVVQSSDTPNSLKLPSDVLAFVMLRPLGSPPPVAPGAAGRFTDESVSPARQLSATPTWQASDASAQAAIRPVVGPPSWSPNAGASYRDRLTAIYTKYQPEKLNTVIGTLRKFAGREEAVIKQLVAKYGPEPPLHEALREAVAAAAAKNASPAASGDGGGVSPGGASTAINLSVTPDRTPGDSNVVSPAAYSPMPSPRESAADGGDANSSSVNANAGASYRDRLTAIYTKYQPEKLNTVIGTLRKFAGREEAVVRSLVKKYGPEPVIGVDVQLPESDATLAKEEEQRTLAAHVQQPAPPLQEQPQLAEAEERPLSYRDRLTAIYTKYQPEKLNTVEGNLRRFAGREEAMLDKLVERYGPEPSRAEAESLLHAEDQQPLDEGASSDSAAVSEEPKERPERGPEPVVEFVLHESARVATPLLPPTGEPKKKEGEEHHVTVEVVVPAIEPVAIGGGTTTSSATAPVIKLSTALREEPLPGEHDDGKEKQDDTVTSEQAHTLGDIGGANFDDTHLDPPMPLAPVWVKVEKEDGPFRRPGVELVDTKEVPQATDVPPAPAVSETRTRTFPPVAVAEAPSPALVVDRKPVAPRVGAAPAPEAPPVFRRFGRTGAACAEFLTRQNGCIALSHAFAAWLSFRDARVARALVDKRGLWTRGSCGGFTLADEVQPAYTVSDLAAHVRDLRSCPRDGSSRPLSDAMVLSLRAILDGLRRCLLSQAIEINSPEERRMADEFLAQWSSSEALCPVRDSDTLAHALQQAARFLAQIEDLMDVARAQDEQLAKLKEIAEQRDARVADAASMEIELKNLVDQLSESKQRQRALEAALEAARATGNGTSTSGNDLASPVSPRHRRTSVAVASSSARGSATATPRAGTAGAAARSPARLAVRSPRASSLTASSTANTGARPSGVEARQEEQIVRLQQELAKTRSMVNRSKSFEDKLRQQLEESEERQMRLRRVVAATAMASTDAHQRPRSRAASARTHSTGSGVGPRASFSRPQLTPRGGNVLDQDERISSSRGGSASPWPKSRHVPPVPEIDRGPCPNCLTPLTSITADVVGSADERAAFCFSCRRSFTFGELSHRDGAGYSQGGSALWSSR